MSIYLWLNVNYIIIVLYAERPEGTDFKPVTCSLALSDGIWLYQLEILSPNTYLCGVGGIARLFCLIITKRKPALMLNYLSHQKVCNCKVIYNFLLKIVFNIC